MFKKLISIATLSMAALGMTACSATQEKPFSEKSNWTNSFLSKTLGGQQMPDGVNNWTCRPKAGEYPVVLVHGTFSSTMYSFGALGPALANEGLCVYAMDYGAAKPGDLFMGVSAVDESAQTIADFVTSVKTATDSSRVTLVGHSQGGLIGFYYLKVLGGAEHVNRFVALAPSVNGTVIAKTPKRELVEYCLACADQHPQSDIMKRLQQGPVTMPGVEYHVLVTKNDKVVLPVEKQFVKEPGVNNLYIQDLLPGKRVSHSGMLYDSDTLALIVKLVTGKPPVKQALN